eukprot:TRINITY_DN9661_c0_g1_i1.p1 TRINITY_DN9661_c0_g1~~TRINITY_DN9661_c0_g1_i1.p1  ORF type:complete len:367 (-),score=96.02 TRINITY_DN9661_c0_g1_i1:173-1273(-)
MGQAESAVEQREFLKAHQRETHFTLAELKKLRKNFKKVATEDGTLSRADFETVLNISFNSSPTASAATFLNRLFDTFDEGKNGKIEFSEFVAGLSVLCRGSIEERTKFTFQIYDTEGKGTILQENMVYVLASMSKIFNNHKHDVLHGKSDHTHDNCPASPSYTMDDIRHFVEKLFREYVSDKKAGMNFYEFCEAVRENPSLLGCTYDLGAEAEKVEGIYSVKYLVAVDGGEHSLRAFEHIARTTRPEDFIYVVYVHPTFDPARRPPYMKADAYRVAYDTKAKEMSEFLERCKNLSIKKSAAPCLPLFCDGVAQEQITKLLDKYDIDVLALGSVGYGDEIVKAQRKEVGSLCRYFINEAICSVLVIK